MWILFCFAANNLYIFHERVYTHCFKHSILALPIKGLRRIHISSRMALADIPNENYLIGRYILTWKTIFAAEQIVSGIVVLKHSSRPSRIPLGRVLQGRAQILRKTSVAFCTDLFLSLCHRPQTLYVCPPSVEEFILSRLPSHPLYADRQKLISSDICFQSKASSLLFPLSRPAIIELTYVPE